MSDQPPAFPPPVAADRTPSAMTGSGVPTVAPSPRRFQHPVALFAVAVGLGLAAAVVLGVAAGALVMGASGSNCSGDGWCELGAAVFGLMAGFLVGVIAYVVVGVVTIHRYRAAGARAHHVLAHLAFPLALVALSSIPGALLS